MFDDGQFDLVNAPLCMDYIFDWSAVFREFKRVLKPGGYFLMSAGHPAFDAEYFATNEYFSVEQVECEWTGFGKRVVMPGFRRSLQEFLMPLLSSGFRLDRIVEPLPTEEFKEADPVRYASLMHRPGFLCVRACT
jgi:SAM-dependent methyltransferase